MELNNILGAQIIGKKNYGLDYARRVTNYINTPRILSISAAINDVMIKIIKHGKKTLRTWICESFFMLK